MRRRGFLTWDWTPAFDRYRAGWKQGYEDTRMTLWSEYEATA